MIMNFPENVKYTKEHEWIRLEGDVAYVGITDYAQAQLGDIVFVDIQAEGETLAADEVFGTIEVVKTISDLFLPVGGEILEQNEALADQPELVNKDPYGERRHKNSEAVHYSKHNQLILYRHDAQVREKEQNQKRQEWNGKRREYSRYHPGCPD